MAPEMEEGEREGKQIEYAEDFALRWWLWLWRALPRSVIDGILGTEEGVSGGISLCPALTLLGWSLVEGWIVLSSDSVVGKGMEFFVVEVSGCSWKRRNFRPKMS